MINLQHLQLILLYNNRDADTDIGVDADTNHSCHVTKCKVSGVILGTNIESSQTLAASNNYINTY